MFPYKSSFGFSPPFNSVFVNHVNDLTLFKCSQISKHHMCKKTCMSALVKIKWDISNWGYNCLNIRKETKMCSNGEILKEDSSIIKIKCIFALCYPLGTTFPQRILGKIWKSSLTTRPVYNQHWQAEANDPDKYLMIQWADPQNKDKLGWNVNSAEVENILNPGLGQWMSNITAWEVLQEVTVSPFSKWGSQPIDSENPQKSGPKFLIYNHKIPKIWKQNLSLKNKMKLNNKIK